MMKTTTFAAAILTFLLPPLLSSAAGADPDRCLAPYFEIQSSGETSVETFPLRNTDTQVRIAGVIAEVTIRQTYVNTGSGVIEATYLFPASTRAAVHGMEMKIGERLVKAKIQEKQKAKATFEKAKAEKKSAALLEQNRPNVFEMSVANILPGDQVEVTLHYSEILRPEEGTYEFVYPSVVGPRYSNRKSSSPDAAQHGWVQNPYLANEAKAHPAKVETGFAFDLELKAGMPIQSLACASHQVEINYQGKDAATIELDGMAAADRDVIVRYRLTDQKISSGLLIHEGAEGGENFFLLNVQPPKRVLPANIPPREYIFVIDVSGSMSGFPLNLAKDLFRDLIGGLRPEDSFNILAFAGSSSILAEKSLPATLDNVKRGIRFIEGRRGGGGTELVNALQKSIRLPGSDRSSRSILVITDGYISMEADAFELVRNELGKANLFAFGIGSSVNRHLIEGLAHVGMGEPFVVTEPAEAKPVAKRLRNYIATPVLTNIKVEATGVRLLDTEPRSVPDVFAARPLTLTGKWTDGKRGMIKVSGLTGGGETFTQEFSFEDAAEAGVDNPGLSALWARERVRALADFALLTKDSETVKEVTNLGLTYSLMTPYTSFVAVDEVAREFEDDARLVKQALPMPKGVPNSAVGGGGSGGKQAKIASSSSSSSASSTPISGGSVPEPGATSLLLIALLSIFWMRNR